MFNFSLKLYKLMILTTYFSAASASACNDVLIELLGGLLVGVEVNTGKLQFSAFINLKKRDLLSTCNSKFCEQMEINKDCNPSDKWTINNIKF